MVIQHQHYFDFDFDYMHQIVKQFGHFSTFAVPFDKSTFLSSDHTIFDRHLLVVIVCRCPSGGGRHE